MFGLIRTKQLEEIIVNLMIKNLALIKKSLHVESNEEGFRLLCIDGKEENGTGRKYSATHDGKVRNLQTLHIYDDTNKICLFSVPIDAKSNEIPAAQAILTTMDLKDTICTFDALHMQRNTISIIRENNGHYVGGLKGNQHDLMKEAASYFMDSEIQKLKKSRKVNKPVYIMTKEHAHSQEEIREFFLVNAKANEERALNWKDLKSFVMCIKTLIPDNPSAETTVEVRYYASDLDDLSVIAEAIRLHWSVEIFHWQMDVSFCEDDNSTMNVNAYNNLSLLNKLCLHLFQLMKLADTKTSINRMRKRFGWNFEGSMEELLSYFHEDAIIQALETDSMSNFKLSDN